MVPRVDTAPHVVETTTILLYSKALDPNCRTSKYVQRQALQNIVLVHVTFEAPQLKAFLVMAS